MTRSHHFYALLLVTTALLALAACSGRPPAQITPNPTVIAPTEMVLKETAPPAPPTTATSVARATDAATVPRLTETPASTPTPTSRPTAPPTPTATSISRLSIEYLREQKYPGADLVIEQTLAPGSNYDRYIASYLSEGLKIYALLTVPRGQPPVTGWPVIVFNHGYIPPSQYRTTERYVAYVDGFARNGYIVFRPDYRGHGNSEGTPTGAYRSPAYVIDVLNAVASVKRYEVADPNRIGMWGHSMGGWITLRAMVASPDIKAGVIWGGVVGAYEDLLEHWRRNRPGAPPGASTSRGGWRTGLIAEFGEPKENPELWKQLSPNYFLTDLAGPIQLHHARGDASVPVKLSEILVEQGKTAGMPIELFAYPGDNHNISGNFNRAMASSVSFFDRWVKHPVNLREMSAPTAFPKVDNVNLRSGPGTDFGVVGQLRIDESLPIIGRSEDGAWWHVQAPTGPAWVAASVALAAHTAGVPIVQAPSAVNG